MDNLESLKADIQSGLVTLISKFNHNGMICRIVSYRGLLFKLYFSKSGEILCCDASDKNFNFDQFVDTHGKHYTFTHVLFQETHHFIYVTPVDVRPWMRRSVNTGVPVWWCIHRHFIDQNGPLPELFENLAKRKDIVVDHYLRELEGRTSEFTKLSFQKLMSIGTEPKSVGIAPVTGSC